MDELTSMEGILDARRLPPSLQKNTNFAIKSTWLEILALMLINFRNEGKHLISWLLSGVAKNKQKQFDFCREPVTAWYIIRVWPIVAVVILLRINGGNKNTIDFVDFTL